MKQRLLDAMFDPPWWAILLNPHFLPRRAIWRAMGAAGPQLRGAVLDVGCGSQPYRRLLGAATKVTGLDLDTPANRSGNKRIDVFYDGGDFPCADASYDGVLCNQVLEHVFEPDRFLAEVVRVLAPGGALVLSVPFFWPEHERPHDSQRFTSHGLAHRFEQAGLEVIAHDKLVPGSAALCAILADRINSAASSLPLPLRLLARAGLAAPVSLLGALLLLRRHRDSAIFLDNFVVARKPGRQQ